MSNCTDNTYNLRFTDSTKPTIFVPRRGLVTDAADIAFPGSKRLEYGEVFNNNILNITENFACPEDPLNPGTPDFDRATGTKLQNPLPGQHWWNSTNKSMYYFDGTNWVRLLMGTDVGGNYGTTSHGEQLPRPVSPVTGYVFEYSECTWNVSPQYFEAEIDYMRCYTLPDSTVVMQYRLVGESELRPGFVNYQILGIRDNVNLGDIDSGSVVPEPSAPAPTVTPTPSPTVGVSSTPNPTPTLTPTPTPLPSSTPTPTPTIGVSVTPTPIVSATPSPTPPVTPTVTPTSTPPVTPTVTPSVTPAVTPTVTPTNTPVTMGVWTLTGGGSTGPFCDFETCSLEGPEGCPPCTVNGATCNPGGMCCGDLGSGLEEINNPQFTCVIL